MAFEEINKRSILVADHNAHMAGLVSIMLRNLGLKEIREVYDSSKALIEVDRRLFDVLIIDDALDGMDGVSFTRKLRGLVDSPNRLVPVIMMSAAPDARRIAEARDAGVTEFLRKPFAAKDLLARLQGIKANPRGFIEATGYAGPDRRRRTLSVGSKDRRDSTPS